MGRGVAAHHQLGTLPAGAAPETALVLAREGTPGAGGWADAAPVSPGKEGGRPKKQNGRQAGLPSLSQGCADAQRRRRQRRSVWSCRAAAAAAAARLRRRRGLLPRRPPPGGALGNCFCAAMVGAKADHQQRVGISLGAAGSARGRARGARWLQPSMPLAMSPGMPGRNVRLLIHAPGLLLSSRRTRKKRALV